MLFAPLEGWRHVEVTGWRTAVDYARIWRDLAVRKRKTEVLAQLGPIVEVAAKHGIPAPLTARLITLIQDIENGTRELTMDNLTLLAAAGKDRPA